MKNLFCGLLLKKAILLLLIAAMAIPQQPLQAQALPIAANYVMNRTLGKAIVANLERRGVQFAANDPAFTRTMAYVGNAANDAMYVHAAVTAVAAVASAPVWLTVALGVGAVAAVGAIAWGAYELSQSSVPGQVMANGEPVPQALQLASPGYDPSNPPEVPEPEPGPGPVADPVPVPAFLPYPTLYRDPAFPTCNPAIDSSCVVFPILPMTMRYVSTVLHHQATGGHLVGGEARQEVLYLAAQAHLANRAGWHIINPRERNWTMTFVSNFIVDPACLGTQVCSWKILYRIDYEKQLQADTDPFDGIDNSIWGVPLEQDGSRHFYGGEITVRPNSAWQPPPSKQAFIGSLGDLQSGITPAMLAAQIPDSLTAQMANRLWQQAASQSGYDGLPYSVAAPITAADIAAFRQTAQMPTWGDLVNTSPYTPGTQTVPIAPDLTSPNPNPDPNPNPNPGGTTVDLGPDPKIGTPMLENTPTAQMILDPLLGLFPTLKNFTVPQHSAECPKPSMTLFEKELILNTHCAVLDEVRPTLYAVMAFVWMALGLIIVLGA